MSTTPRRIYPSRCRRGQCSVPRCKEEQAVVLHTPRSDGSITERGLCDDHAARRENRLSAAS